MICYIFLDNGVMTTQKRRILLFVFTVLCDTGIGVRNLKNIYYIFTVIKWMLIKISRSLDEPFRLLEQML